jgi:hypothetical protein
MRETNDRDEGIGMPTANHISAAADNVPSTLGLSGKM